MKRLTEKFNDTWITFLVADEFKSCLFKADDIAKAVGYYDTSSLMRNIDNKPKYVNPYKERFLSLRQINKAAKKAVRTPFLKEFAEWARRLSDRMISDMNPVNKVQKQESSDWPLGTKTLDKIAADHQMYTLKEVAEKLGMHHSAFITWMTGECYLSTFKSNGHLKMTPWFKEKGYGKNPLAASGRISNTIRITGIGLEFLKKQLESDREESVLAFAADDEQEREKEVSNLIDNKFDPFKYESDYSGLSIYKEYRIDNPDLQRVVREIVAEIKLKDKE